ncbi:MAG: MATE family efflux transporter [Desulfobacterales bacterium]|nr:MAG: MATE family efflux transporter [Desulfobacterales bacterium]
MEENRLITAPIPGLIREIAVPVSIGMLFNTLYNVVDTWFAGMVSTEALAALGVSLPVFIIMVSFGSGLGIGAKALIGDALGRGDKNAASEYAVQTIGFSLCLSLLLTVLGLKFSPFLFRVMGAEESWLPICLEYMDILFYSAPLFFFVYMLTAFLNALGLTRIFRNFLIIGFCLNVILDPWFIFGGAGVPAMGVSGIALATVLVQAVGVVYLGGRVRQTGLIRPGAWRHWRPAPPAWKNIAMQGLPAGLNTMSIALGVFLIAHFTGQFGKTALAAYGVGMRVEQIVLLPVIGLNTTVLTLTAQNFGAGKPERVRAVLKISLWWGGWIMAAGTAAVWFGAPFFMKIFSDDPEVIAIGIGYLRVDAFVLYAYVILFVSVAGLQGLRRPIFPLWIGLGRQIIAPWAVFHVIVNIWGKGISGIWWGIFGITWAAALITWFYARHAAASIPAPGVPPLPVTAAPRHTRENEP